MITHIVSDWLFSPCCVEHQDEFIFERVAVAYSRDYYEIIINKTNFTFKNFVFVKYNLFALMTFVTNCKIWRLLLAYDLAAYISLLKFCLIYE